MELQVMKRTISHNICRKELCSQISKWHNSIVLVTFLFVVQLIYFTLTERQGNVDWKVSPREKAPFECKHIGLLFRVYSTLIYVNMMKIELVLDVVLT